jgi:hypothetical protein
MPGISPERVVVLIELEKPLDLIDQCWSLRTGLFDVSSVEHDPTLDAIEEEEHVPDICAVRATCGEPVKVGRA